MTDLYRLVKSAVETKHPISAIYHGRPRLLCPHRLGRNKLGSLRVLCYQYGGGSETGLQRSGSPDNWRCLVLDELSEVKLLSDKWRTGPNHTWPASCIVDVHADAEDPTPRQGPQSIG